MADTGKVRLVRCPKCENLLPELPDYSVYQCGGCGAVLRANIQQQGPDAAAAQSLDDEENVQASEKPGMFESNDASEAKANPNDGLLMLNGNLAEENGRKGCYPKNLVSDSGGGGGSGTKGIFQNENDLTFFDKQQVGQNGDFSSRVEQVMERSKNVHNVRFPVSKLEEGPSTSPHLDPLCSSSREVPFQKLDGMVRDTRVQCLENDRAELLRKLDELKDQLSRSCNVVAEPKDNRVPPTVRRTLSSDTSYGGGPRPSTWLPNGPTSSNKASMQLFGHDQIGPFLNRCPEMLLCNDRHDISRGSYPSMQNPNLLPTYHLPPPHHHYYSGQCKFINNSYDAFEPLQHGKILEQSACGCFHCNNNNKHHEVLEPFPSFCKKPFPDVTMYHPENASSFGSRPNHRSVFHPFSSYHEPHRYIRRWSGLKNPERADLPPRKMSLTTIAGGAPIIACCNCFELLQLPKKVMLLPENQQKLRCGACSNIIYFSVVDKKIIFPIEAGDRINRGASANFSSDDFDNSGYEFHAMAVMERKSAQPSASRTNNSQETEESLPTSSPTPDGPKASHSPAGSPLQEHFDYSSSSTHRFGKGNRSSRSSDKEKALLSSKTTLRQNSLNEEVSLATELEVSYNNDYSNNGGSQDSSKDDDDQRGGESFLANFIKKSFKDFSRNNHGKTTVTVNGYPIPARLIKKAEKLAGQIQPGNYWYDSRAGFWGVMGGPCLGIIPPYIEEFNYPMPDKCGGGDTGIFVNGRELHKQDLELLATRGLPADRDRSYIIEISGRVLDEDTGEELDCLGRLAPTVEKVKHGFGMKAPRAVA